MAESSEDKVSCGDAFESLVFLVEFVQVDIGIYDFDLFNQEAEEDVVHAGGDLLKDLKDVFKVSVFPKKDHFEPDAVFFAQEVVQQGFRQVVGG